MKWQVRALETVQFLEIPLAENLAMKRGTTVDKFAWVCHCVVGPVF